MTTNELKKIILEEGSVSPDQAGFTPLSKLGVTLKASKYEDKIGLERTISDLVDYFDTEFTAVHLKNLSSLIYFSDLKGSNIIYEKYYPWLIKKRSENSEENLAKKINVLQIISSLRMKILNEDLFITEYRKSMFFWNWISVVIRNKDAHIANEYLIERIKSEPQEAIHFFRLLPTLLQQFDKPAFRKLVSSMYDILKSSTDRKTLKEWCEKRFIQIINHITERDISFLLSKPVITNGQIQHQL